MNMNEASIAAPPATAGSVLSNENSQQANVQTTASQVAAQPTSQIESWYSNIKDDGLRGYAETKNFNSNEELLNAYKQLDDLGIAERAGNTMLKPDYDNPESMNNFYKAIGRPDSPDAYKLLPEGQQQTTFSKDISKVFFDAGLTSKQVEAITSSYNEMSNNLNIAQQKEFETNSASQMEELKKEWGSDYGRNVEMFRRGVKGLGATNEEFANIEKAIGTKRSVELFKNAASGLTESQFKSSGDANPAYFSPQGAQAELNRLSIDKNFAEKLMNNEVSAIEKWERLNRLAMENNNE